MEDMANKKLVIFAIVLLLGGASILPVLITGNIEMKKAEAAWAAEEFEIATESFARAAKLLPWRAELWEKAGISASMQPDLPNAIFYLSRASALSEAGWATLGYSYYFTGDLTLARQAFEKGVGSNACAECLAGLASIYRDQKDWPAEHDALENQLKLDDKNVFAHYRLGLLLMVLQPEQALPELMLASSLDPQFGPAVNTLRAALNGSPTPASPAVRRTTIGRALGLVQEWDLSVAAFEKSIELDPESAEAWAWLGEARQQTGKDGRQALDRAVALDHKSVTVRALRGLYWGRQEKYQQMLAEYLLAAEYEPQNPAWQASIGDAQIKLGNLAAALDAYQHATELAPDDSTYWRLLAVFCAENGVRVEDLGLPAARQAAELAPEDPLAL